MARAGPRGRDRRGRRGQEDRDRADRRRHPDRLRIAAGPGRRAGRPAGPAGDAARRPDRGPAAELLAVRRPHAGLPACRDRPGHGAARAPPARAGLLVRAQRGPRPGRTGRAARLRPPADGGGTPGRLARPGTRAGRRPGRSAPGPDRAVRRARCRGRTRAGPAGPGRRRGVPALRRHHRAAQADRPHPQRLLLQRARLGAAVPPGRGHGLSRLAARLAQLPAGLPRHPRHPAVRRPGGHARLARSGQRLRRHRAGGRHGHRRGARGGPALAGPRRGPRRLRVRRAAHAGGPAGRRRPAGRRAGLADQAGPRRDAAAGVRHGRGAAELHQAGRPGRGDLRHPGPAAEPGRRGPHRRCRRQRPARRPAGRAADPRAVHAARLLPGAGAERPRLHPGRLVRQRRRGAPPAGRQPRGRGPGQGHDQPGRGEDLGRGGGEPALPDAGDRPGRRRRRARRRTRRADLRLRRPRAGLRTSPWARSPMAWRRPG